MLKKKFPIENQFVLLVTILTIIYFFIGNNLWNSLIVPVGDYNQSFQDFRCVEGWSKLIKNYKDLNLIYNENTGCLLNYPKIWIKLSNFISNYQLFYFVIIINFIIYNYIFYNFIKFYQSYFVFYFYFSGVSLLLLERGNVDIIIFILIYLSFSKNNIFNLILTLLSIFLKIFPILSIARFLEKKHITSLVFLLIISATYFIFNFEEISLAFNNGPKTGDLSYGILAITSNINKHLYIEFNFLIVSVVFFISLLVLYILFLRNKMSSIQFKNNNMFLAGSGIFIFSFLITSSFDYRLIFLFFTFPLLLNLKNNQFKNFLLILIILSSEVHRLIYLFGFMGGVLNNFAKLLLFSVLLIIFIDILFKRSIYYFKQVKI